MNKFLNLTIALSTFSLAVTAFAGTTQVGSAGIQSSALTCSFTADPKNSHISLAVDEGNSTQDTVLLGVNMAQPDGYTKSVITKHDDLIQQIQKGVVILPLASEADPKASEIFDSNLFAVVRVAGTDEFDGYLALQADGLSTMPIKCVLTK